MSLKVSIIVPVYNTEKYLHRCIDSILAQTFTDFELLLVNDGSIDSSGAICDEYAMKDSRIRVFHKENGGVSSARNFGLSRAKGQWIAFIDSDDSIETCYLKNIIEFEADDIDIVVTGASVSEKISSNEYVNRILRKMMPVELWGKLIRLDVIRNALDIPREIYYGEDMIANIAIGLNAHRKIVCVNNCFYQYRINLESVSHHREVNLDYEEAFLDIVANLLSVDKVLYSDGLNILRLASLELLVVCKKRVQYDRISWLADLSKWASSKELSVRQRIVIYVSNNFLCRYLLAIERKLSFFNPSIRH